MTRVQALHPNRHPFGCCDAQLLGLGLIGYAAYLAHKEPSTFLYMVIGLGCGMVLGMVGCCFVISQVPRLLNMDLLSSIVSQWL